MNNGDSDERSDFTNAAGAGAGQSCGSPPQDVSLAMDAVASALAGSVITTSGEAATIAAELATPALDLIKQEEQVSPTVAGG